MAKTKRVQVLMDPQEFELLAKAARDRGTSVADLMREAARAQHLAEHYSRRSAEAARSFLNLPDTVLPQWKELEDEIEGRRDPAVS